jgi:hypothetical protein
MGIPKAATARSENSDSTAATDWYAAAAGRKMTSLLDIIFNDHVT